MILFYFRRNSTENRRRKMLMASKVEVMLVTQIQVVSLNDKNDLKTISISEKITKSGICSVVKYRESQQEEQKLQRSL